MIGEWERKLGGDHGSLCASCPLVLGVDLRASLSLPWFASRKQRQSFCTRETNLELKLGMRKGVKIWSAGVQRQRGSTDQVRGDMGVARASRSKCTE